MDMVNETRMYGFSEFIKNLDNWVEEGFTKYEAAKILAMREQTLILDTRLSDIENRIDMIARVISDK